ncbi:hypothetical protein ACFWR9_11445 [Streptomyces sp. NPDC058534]|uniref:zinc finger domain-containing protein n=1 Tax=Streptomyces sp. NPDC058534 TaxID=3346541 RepID=UPI0036492752
MTEPPTNALQFHRDLARLQEQLEHAGNEYLPIEHQSPAAAGFLKVINELTAGADPTAAVARAMDCYFRVDEAQRAHAAATEARRQREEQDLESEEEITRKVECPGCGAAAGLRCKGTGASGGLKKKSHRVRFRLARQLNDQKGTTS